MGFDDRYRHGVRHSDDDLSVLAEALNVELHEAADILQQARRDAANDEYGRPVSMWCRLIADERTGRALTIDKVSLVEAVLFGSGRRRAPPEPGKRARAQGRRQRGGRPGLPNTVGKRTLAEQEGHRRDVLRTLAGRGVGVETAVVVASGAQEQTNGQEPSIQLEASGASPDLGVDATAIARAGLGGSPQALPHLATIQHSFGKHDVSKVRAYVGGGAAAESADRLGANAYAYGDAVAFAVAPDLRLAAHEATHVVQQRGGVYLADGIGDIGDVYERHADRVADAVVRGNRAESLLDQMPSAGGASAAVQMDRKQPVFWVGNNELGEIYHLAGALRSDPNARYVVIEDLTTDKASGGASAATARAIDLLGRNQLDTSRGDDGIIRCSTMDQIKAGRRGLASVRDTTRTVGDALTPTSAAYRPNAASALRDALIREPGSDPVTAQRNAEREQRIRSFLAEQAAIEPRLIDPNVPKVLVWIRAGSTHEAWRDTSPKALRQFVSVVRGMGLTPVLVGPPLAARGTDGAINFTNHWLHPAFHGIDTWRAQLLTFDLLHREHGVKGQLGMKSGGADGPALLGIPTIYVTDSSETRMTAWEGIGSYEGVRDDRYRRRKQLSSAATDSIRDKLRGWEVRAVRDRLRVRAQDATLSPDDRERAQRALARLDAGANRRDPTNLRALTVEGGLTSGDQAAGNGLLRRLRLQFEISNGATPFFTTSGGDSDPQTSAPARGAVKAGTAVQAEIMAAYQRLGELRSLEERIDRVRDVVLTVGLRQPAASTEQLLAGLRDHRAKLQSHCDRFWTGLEEVSSGRKVTVGGSATGAHVEARAAYRLVADTSVANLSSSIQLHEQMLSVENALLVNAFAMVEALQRGESRSVHELKAEQTRLVQRAASVLGAREVLAHARAAWQAEEEFWTPANFSRVARRIGEMAAHQEMTTRMRVAAGKKIEAQLRTHNLVESASHGGAGAPSGSALRRGFAGFLVLLEAVHLGVELGAGYDAAKRTLAAAADDRVQRGRNIVQWWTKRGVVPELGLLDEDGKEIELRQSEIYAHLFDAPVAGIPETAHAVVVDVSLADRHHAVSELALVCCNLNDWYREVEDFARHREVNGWTPFMKEQGRWFALVYDVEAGRYRDLFDQGVHDELERLHSYLRAQQDSAVKQTTADAKHETVRDTGVVQPYRQVWVYDGPDRFAPISMDKIHPRFVRATGTHGIPPLPEMHGKVWVRAGDTRTWEALRRYFVPTGQQWISAHGTGHYFRMNEEGIAWVNAEELDPTDQAR